MADVFISYSRSDDEWARSLSTILQRRGLTVWWDVELMPAQEFRERIEKELEAAYAVVVFWSPDSRTSHWVPDEAQIGLEAGKLVQVSLDDDPPPLGFRKAQVHFPDRSDQYLDRMYALNDRKLLEAIEQLVPPRQALDALKSRIQQIEKANAESAESITSGAKKLAALEKRVNELQTINENRINEVEATNENRINELEARNASLLEKVEILFRSMRVQRLALIVMSSFVLLSIVVALFLNSDPGVAP